MTGRLVVCPLSRLGETVAIHRPGAAVSLATGPSPPHPALMGLPRLALDVSDIAEARAGHVLAGEAHVAGLLAFARAWDRRAPLVIHCYAGVSRSPAAALVVACALDPRADEARLARRLRALSPTATPNPRLVALGDAALGRGGRLVEAVRAIGRGRDGFEGEVFALDLGG